MKCKMDGKLLLGSWNIVNEFEKVSPMDSIILSHLINITKRGKMEYLIDYSSSWSGIPKEVIVGSLLKLEKIGLTEKTENTFIPTDLALTYYDRNFRVKGEKFLSILN